MTFSHPCASSGRQVVTYIKSPNTKIQLQTFSTTSRKKHYGVTRKNDFFMVDFGHVLGNEMWYM